MDYDYFYDMGYNAFTNGLNIDDPDQIESYKKRIKDQNKLNAFFEGWLAAAREACE